MAESGRTLNISPQARVGIKKNTAARRPLIADCLALPTPGQIFGDDMKEAVGFVCARNQPCSVTTQ